VESGRREAPGSPARLSFWRNGPVVGAPAANGERTRNRFELLEPGRPPLRRRPPPWGGMGLVWSMAMKYAATTIPQMSRRYRDEEPVDISSRLSAACAG